MSELYMAVGLYAKEGKEHILRDDLIAVVKPSQKEEGCIRYELFIDENDNGHFVFVEHWASFEAQQQHHLHSEHIKYFNANGAANVDKITFHYKLRKLA